MSIINGIECPDKKCSNDVWREPNNPDETEWDYACVLCGTGVKVEEEDGRIEIETCSD